jgi:hypothetical protein
MLIINGIDIFVNVIIVDLTCVDSISNLFFSEEWM